MSQDGHRNSAKVMMMLLAPAIVAVLSLLAIYFDCWSEIYWPVHSRQWTGLSRLSTYILYGATLVAIVVLVVVLLKKVTSRDRILAGLSTLICASLFVLLPLRFDFFFLGSKSRVARGGGIDRLREAGLSALAESSVAIPTVNMSGFSYLTDDGKVSVSVDGAAGLVEIRLPPRSNFSDEFSYVVMRNSTGTIPFRTWRTWQLANGVLFCEK